MANTKKMIRIQVVDNFMKSIFCWKYFFVKCTICDLTPKNVWMHLAPFGDGGLLRVDFKGLLGGDSSYDP